MDNFHLLGFIFFFILVSSIAVIGQSSSQKEDLSLFFVENVKEGIIDLTQQDKEKLTGTSEIPKETKEIKLPDETRIEAEQNFPERTEITLEDGELKDFTTETSKDNKITITQDDDKKVIVQGEGKVKITKSSRGYTYELKKGLSLIINDLLRFFASDNTEILITKQTYIFEKGILSFDDEINERLESLEGISSVELNLLTGFICLNMAKDSVYVYDSKEFDVEFKNFNDNYNLCLKKLEEDKAIKKEKPSGFIDFTKNYFDIDSGHLLKINNLDLSENYNNECNMKLILNDKAIVTCKEGNEENKVISLHSFIQKNGKLYFKVGDLFKNNFNFNTYETRLNSKNTIVNIDKLTKISAKENEIKLFNYELSNKFIEEKFKVIKK